MSTPIAGVYALRHRPTGSVYIGSSATLQSRLKRWRNQLSSGYMLPARIGALSLGVANWDITVIVDGSDLTIAEIRADEERAIMRIAARAPHLLLNAAAVGMSVGVTAAGRTQSLRSWSEETGTPHQTIAARLRGGKSPEQAVGLEALPAADDEEISAFNRATALKESMVLVFDGEQVLTQREVAQRLQCSQDSIRKRLQRYRVVGGQGAVQMKELQELTNRYRKK